MKLPSIAGQVSSSTPTPVAPNVAERAAMAKTMIAQGASAARAQIAAGEAKTRAITGMATGIAKMAFDYQAAEVKKEADDFDIKGMNASSDWDLEHGSRIEYSPDEVSESVRAEAGIHPEQDVIPAYKVQPFMKREYLQDWANQNSEFISDSGVREEAVNNFNRYEAQEFTQQVGKSLSAQPVYNMGKTIEMANDALEKRDYNTAREIWSRADVPEKLRDAKIDELSGQEQNFTLGQVEGYGSVEDMQLMAKNLEEPNFMPNLSQPERRMWRTRLEAKTQVVEAKLTTAQKAANFQVEYEAGQLVANLEAAMTPNPEVFNATLAKLKTLPFSKTTARLINRLQEAAVVNITVAEDARLPQGQAEQQLTEMRKGMGTGSTLEDTVRGKRIKALETNIRERQTDYIEWAQRTGAAPVGPLDLGNIAASVSQRVNAVTTGKNQFSTFTGYLANSEVPTVSSFVEQQDINGKLGIFSQVFDGLGKDINKSVEFWEQFKNESFGGTMPVAAQLASKGKAGAARMVLRGSEIRVKNPEYFKLAKTNIDSYLTNNMGTAFNFNNTERQLTREAIYDTYAYLASKDGDMAHLTNQDRIKRAMNLVTGGITEYGDVRIQAPVHGASSENVIGWLDGMTKEDFKDAKHPQRAVELMQSEDMKVVQMEANRFRLSDGHFFMPGKDNKPFEFSYPDTNTPEEPPAPPAPREKPPGRGNIAARKRAQELEAKISF